MNLTADNVDMLDKDDNNRSNCNVSQHIAATRRPNQQCAMLRSCCIQEGSDVNKFTQRKVI